MKKKLLQLKKMPILVALILFSFVALKAQPSFTLNAPNGGQNFAVNSVQTISWTVSMPVMAVQLELSINNGATWGAIATVPGSTATTGAYSWTVPNAPSNTCRVRAYSGSTLTAGVSASVFTISPGSNISLTTPNGGQNWQVGSIQTIQWNNMMALPPLNIDYSINNGATWSVVATGVPAGGMFGTYAWTIPNTVSSNCLVRLNAGGINTSTSLATFSISPASSSITLSAPNGGESWVVGSTQNITWNNMAPFSTVQIEYSTNAGSTWSTVIASTPAGGSFGSYSWTIPNTVSNQCRVRVNAGGPNIDASNNNFNIVVATPSIVLTSPNGGENWTVGSNQVITWNNLTFFSTVQLEYSTNAGSTWSTVIASTPAGGTSGSYNWTIPNTISSQCLVSVNAGGPNIDVSNSTFTISAPVPQLTVTAPNGGENWVVGTNQVISWMSMGPITTVQIEYSINNGSTYSTVIASTPNGVSGGTYNWTIPNTISNQCLVRVNGGGINVDVSNNMFNIVAASPSITLTSPNGGENWVVGTSQTITWMNMAPFTTVQIEYSIDAGSTWSTVIASTPAGGSMGSYTGVIPNTPSSQCLVRVNAGGANVDQSNGTFSITAPVGIKNSNANFGVTVYPNPTNDVLNLSGDLQSISKVELLDISGRILLDTKSTEKISLENFNTGIYFIKLTAINQTKIIKIVKE